MSDEEQLAASIVGRMIVAAEWHPVRWRSLSASLNVQETAERLVLVLDDGRRIEMESWGRDGPHGILFGPELQDD